MSVLEVFDFCPFPLLSEYIRYNRKLNIAFNFRIHMHDEKNKKCDVTMLLAPPTVTNCNTSSDPLKRYVLYGRPLMMMLIIKRFY